MRILTRSTATLLLALLLWGCGSESTPQEDIQRAKDFLAADETPSAILELKNALQKDHYQPEARWLLGKAYLDSGDPASAEKELERAMWMEWDPNDIVPAYAESLLGVSKYAEALKLSSDGLNPTALASLQSVQAMAKVALGENQDAAELAEKALAVNPDAKYALLAKAQLSVNLGNVDAAEASIDQMLEANQEDSSAWMAMAEVQKMQNEPEKAAEAYDKAIELDPKNAIALYQRSMMALEQGDNKTARRGANKLLRASPRNPGANFIQGYLSLQDNDPKKAAKHLEFAEPMSEQYPQVIFFLASAHFMDSNFEIAATHAERFVGMVPGSVRGRKLLATIRMQAERYSDAEELMRPVVDAMPEDPGALKLMAGALLRQQKTEEGIEMLARVAKLEPESADAQVSLGAGLLMDGKPEDARMHLEAALELQPDLEQADLLLALSALEEQDFDKALAAAQGWAKKSPQDTTPVNLMAYIHAQSGDMQKAKETYQSVLAQNPADPGANHSLAQVALQFEDYDTAIGHYNTILEVHKDHLPSMIQLALIDARRNDEESLAKHLEQAIEAHPDAVEPRLIKARYFLATGRPEKVSTAFLGLDDTKMKDPNVQQTIAIAQLAGEEHAEALFTLEKLSEDNPDSAHNQYLAGLAAAGTGDNDLAEEKLTAALAIDSNHEAARLALAKLYARSGRYDDLQGELKRLAKMAPDNADVLLLRAVGAREAGNPTAAVLFAQKAYDKVPHTNTVLALGSYLEVAGETDAAQKLYRSWLQENPTDSTVRLKLAVDEMAAGADATASYREVLAQDENNVIALNNLAWLLRDSDPKESLQLARKAAQLAPRNAAVLDTLAMVELANGNLMQAERNIMRALDQQPEEPSMQYHRALIQQANGQEAEAAMTLKDVLAGDGDFPEKAEAKALYDSLK